MPNNDIVCKTFLRGDILGEARPLAEVKFISDTDAVCAMATTPRPRQHTSVEKLSILKGIHERLNQSDVPASRKAEYVRLLAEFEDTISADQEDIGLTDVTQHNIELPNGSSDPAFKGQFRLAFEHLQLIKDNVVGWLKNGLIEKSNSKFNAPVFCVPKPHGHGISCLLYTSPSPRDKRQSRMPSSA